MADPAKRRLRRKIDRLALALDGSLAEHQRLLLRMHTRRLEEIGRGLAEVEAAIVAEIGADMAVFGTAQRLAAWAGLCPANHESAARQTPRGTRKGNPYFEATLVTAAVCGARTKGSYLRDKLPSFRPSKCTNAHQNGILGSRGRCRRERMSPCANGAGSGARIRHGSRPGGRTRGRAAGRPVGSVDGDDPAAGLRGRDDPRA